MDREAGNREQDSGRIETVIAKNVDIDDKDFRNPAELTKQLKEKLTYTIAEVCSAANFGRTTVYVLIGTGALRAVKVGRRTMVLADDLKQFLQNRSGTSSAPSPAALRWFCGGRQEQRYLRAVMLGPLRSRISPNLAAGLIAHT